MKTSVRMIGCAIAACLGTLGWAGPTFGAVIVVNSPGVHTTPVMGPTFGDPIVAGTWLRENVRSGSSIGIDGTYPRSGTGSIFMKGIDGNTSKGDMEFYGAPFAGRLGDLTSFGYDWYRDAVSTNPNTQAPSMRLFIDFNTDGDNNPTTNPGGGLLIYEPIYNGVGPPVPTNSWQSVSADLNNGIFWWRQFGVGSDDSNGNSFTRNISDYFNSANINAGFATLSPNNYVYGANIGFGSGWNGLFQGAADNVRLGFGQTSTTYNFEVAASADIPEPASLAVFGALAVGAAGLARRRRAA